MATKSTPLQNHCKDPNGKIDRGTIFVLEGKCEKMENVQVQETDFMKRQGSTR